MQGIHDGFDIGWIQDMEPTYVSDPYLPVTDHEVLQITNWICKRHASGILLGPFSEQTCPFDNVHSVSYTHLTLPTTPYV